MKYEKVRDDRQMRSLTGLTISQFEKMILAFSVDYKKWQEQVYLEGVAKGTRQRHPGGGSKGKLPKISDKLFFTLVYLKTYPTFDVLATQFGMLRHQMLVYLKTYPTFDVLATQFGMSRSKANENVHKLVPILSQTLVRLGVMPHREFSSAEEMKKAFEGIDRVLVDVTERLYRRSQDDEIQREHYSGKKNITQSKTQ